MSLLLRRAGGWGCMMACWGGGFKLEAGEGFRVWLVEVVMC